MSPLKRNSLLAAALAMVALAAVIGCSKVGNNPNRSDTVIEVTSITAVSSDPTIAVDDSTTMSLLAQPRNGAATTFFNDVSFTSYTAEFSTDQTGATDLVAFSGIINSGFVPAGGSATLTVVLVPAGQKQAAFTGDILRAKITVRGKDFSDHTVQFTANTTVTFTATPDGDGDGVPDATDNCPTVPNPSQIDSFPIGGNGVGDCCDPTTPGFPACVP